MATFLADIPNEDFHAIIQELERQPIAVNIDRKQSGPGRSQAFGIVKRMSYRPWVSRNCWLRPTLWKLILEFAEKHLPEGFVWKACQLNMNYTSQPHKDKGNQGDSMIVGFGEYIGGALVINDVPYDIRHKAYLFNGSQHTHYNVPHAGTKYSMVFFDFKMPNWWPGGELPTCKVIEHAGKDWLRVDDCDGAQYLLRKKSRIVMEPPQIPMARVGLVSSDLSSFNPPA
jgi:hypothetical protein